MKRKIKEISRNAAAAAFLVTAIILGGASGDGAGSIANAVLQILSLAIILYCLWADRRIRLPTEAKPLIYIGFAFVIFCMLTFIPLPPGIWEALPGRERAAAGLRLIDWEGHALPFALSPQRTIASLMWVLPPLAAFLLTLRTADRGRKMLPVAILGLAILMVGLGVAQLIAGDVALRPYEVTNPGLAVGMFAGANHFATFLLCALPFSGYLAARAVRKQSGSKRVSGFAVAGATALFLVIGVGIIGSLAGYGLLVVIASATVLIYRKAAVGNLNALWLAGVAALFVGFLAIAFAGPLQEKALTGKFGDQRTSRKVMAQTTVEAIKESFPAGTGLGSFPLYYRTIEDPTAIGVEIINHAHNDYLEIALELGVVGVLLILAFLAWWATRSLQIWRSNVQGSDLGRVGSVIVLVVLVHSLVEYPIRTSAIAAFFATACALMIPPIRSEGQSKRRSRGGREVELTHLEAD